MHITVVHVFCTVPLRNSLNLESKILILMLMTRVDIFAQMAAMNEDFEQLRQHVWDSGLMKTNPSFYIAHFCKSIPDESVGTAVKLVIETKIRLYIHYIYSHTTNLNES